MAGKTIDTLTAASGGDLATTSVLPGVQSGGGTAKKFTIAQIAALVLATPTITGHPTVEGVTSTGATGTGKFVFDTSPTLTTPVVNNNILTESTTSRTLALSDSSAYIRCTNGSATTVTVPANATVAFPVGTNIDIFQAGAGQVTIAAAGGVTINSTPGLKLAAQFNGASLMKVATDTWDLVGGLSA